MVSEAAGSTPRRNPEALDEGLGCLNIAELGLNFDEMPVILIRRLIGQRQFSRLEFLI